MAKGQKSIKKNFLKQKKSKKVGRRSNADRVLAQGTGRSVMKAFGNTSVPRSMSLPNGCWDAFNSCHAALPRAVGPYTVVRTSALLTSSAKFIMIGTTRVQGGSAAIPNENIDYWSNICMAESIGTGAIKNSKATKFSMVKAPGGNANDRASSTFTCCPAAISAQVMGKSNLQSADGQLAAAVVPARMDLYGDVRPWETIGNDLVSYFRPRLMSAGKLSLRGIQMDSHPLSMADVSQFLPMEPTNAPIEPEGGWNGAGMPHFTGWAPMCVYNPDGAALSILVSIEWRVRFDMNDPAVSSHSHHGVTTDSAWDKGVQRATAMLPGVLDIVEKVANTGAAVYNIARGAAFL